MRILFWDVESTAQENLIDLVGGMVTFVAFKSENELIESASEQSSIVLLDLDFDKKSVEKVAKKLRKLCDDCKIIYLCNSMSSADLVKHQKSKVGADIYFKTPLDIELFKLVMEDVSGQEFLEGSSFHDQDNYEDDAPLDQEYELHVHETLAIAEQKFVEEVVKSYSDEDSVLLDEINSNIQASFDSVFSDQDESTGQLQRLAELESREDEISEKFEFGELEIVEDEDEYELVDEDYDFEDDENHEEISTELGLHLDEIEVIIDQEENLDGVLDLTSEEFDFSNISEDGELIRNKKETEEVKDISLENDQDISSGQNEVSLSIDDSQELVLLDDSNINQENLDSENNDKGLVMDNDKELDLGDPGELELDEGSGEELSLENNDGEIDLELEDASSLELSQTGDEPLELSDDSLELSDEPLELSDDSLELSDESIELSDDSLELSDELNELSNDGSEIENMDLDSNEVSVEDLKENFTAQEFEYETPSNELMDDHEDNEDVDFEQSESVMAKLAEIDALMDDDVISDEELFETPRFDQEEEEAFIQDSEVTGDISQSLKDFNEMSNIHTSELEKLGYTIKALREDREELIEKVHELESNQGNEKKEVLDLRSQLDEKKIELAVIKKRMEKQIEDLKLELNISLQKKDIAELKRKELEQQVESLEKKVKVDLSQVHLRERELENKLELLKDDTQLQIRNREQIILELRRKIDTLEFDLETLQGREKKNLASKNQQQDKVEKVIEKLKNAIGELEDDSMSASLLQDIKKNLDV